MQAQSISLIFRRHPAPCSSFCEVFVAVEAYSEPRQEIAEGPKRENAGVECLIPDAHSVDGSKEGMKGNGQNEEGARDIARMKQPRLSKAGRMRCQDVILMHPVKADQEGCCLLHVGQQEIQDQDDILIVPYEGLVVQSPCQNSEADETDQTH